MRIKDRVQAMTPARFTASQAAEKIGKTEKTLQRWRKDKILVPSDGFQAGGLFVYLYTQEDIDKGLEVARTNRPGRKRKSQPTT